MTGPHEGDTLGAAQEQSLEPQAGTSRSFDRRSFLKALTAGLVALTPVAYFLRPSSSPTYTGFRFKHDESVTIVLDFAKDADRYDVSVRRNGEEVEFFANADPMQFDQLLTDHVEVEYFDPVAA